MATANETAHTYPLGEVAGHLHAAFIRRHRALARLQQAQVGLADISERDATADVAAVYGEGPFADDLHAVYVHAIEALSAEDRVLSVVHHQDWAEALTDALILSRTECESLAEEAEDLISQIHHDLLRAVHTVGSGLEDVLLGAASPQELPTATLERNAAELCDVLRSFLAEARHLVAARRNEPQTLQAIAREVELPRWDQV